MMIVGAGLAGLLAANLMPDAHIIEAGPERDVGQHKALLRFRSDAVGNAVGIEFKEVTVHKGVYHDGNFVRPDIRLANWYSKKVIGGYADRSVWKVEPSQRFIAPENLYERLVARCKGRIEWSCSFNDMWEQRDTGYMSKRLPVISTAPMHVIARAVGMTPPETCEFRHAPVRVKRWRIDNAKVYQTIYFPSLDVNLYRASITGDLLIAEYVENPFNGDGDELLLEAFGLSIINIVRADGARGDAAFIPLDETKQKYGKIAPITEAWRRECILQLTLQHRIYSLGRFAVWKNILLDDCLQDIYVIKRLIESGSAYDHVLKS